MKKNDSTNLETLLGALTARPDGLGLVLNVGAGRVHVKELSSVLRVEAREEQRHAEGPGEGRAVGVGLAELDGQVGNSLE